MEKSKLILPITILVSIIILGGFLYAIQVNKQQSIEKQQNIELEEKRRIEEAKIEQEKIKKDALAEQERETKEARENCLIEAHERFVNEGQSACFELGYSQEDIDNLKCKLPAAEIKRLEDKQTDAQEFCLKVYK